MSRVWIAGILGLCTVFALTLPAAQAAGGDLPVGYDEPWSDAGGPSLTGGLEWVSRVWPNTISFADKPAWEKPTVMFLTNYGGVDTLHELSRRFPMDVLHLYPESGNEFPDRERFYELLRSREHIDCFVLSRLNHRTMPADIQYEILSRVKDGAGLVVVDCYDWSETFTPQFLGLKVAQQGKDLIRGIPYAGLRKWENTVRQEFVSFNYWNTGGALNSKPQELPYEYRKVDVCPFGKGTTIWIDTGTHWARAGREGRTLLPHIEQNHSMWVETDYLYSHTAKTILKACGRVPELEVVSVSLTPKAGDDWEAQCSLIRHGDRAFSGTLRWQVRDTWGIVAASGREELNVEPGEQTYALKTGKRANAGRHFIDVWLETEDGRVVDWGSGFADVDGGIGKPVIDFRYPDGAPRGTDLSGTVTAKGAPAGSSVRVALVDRYWRDVGRTVKPIANAPVRYAFPQGGLDGQIWTLKADVIGPGGVILARNWRNVTSPHTRATRGGFHSLMTCCAMACPEEAARREYLRRLGFLSNRPYTPGSALMGEAMAWSDIQMFPFPFNIGGASNDYKYDGINDWEEPRVKSELLGAMEFITDELSPFGLRGFNFTDDSAPAKELTSGAYTTMKFHEWLKEEYGGLEGVVKAWGLDPRSFHGMGRIHREMIKKEYDAGNTAPWIDAQRFLNELWIRHLEEARAAAKSVNADIVAGSDAGYYGSSMAELFGRLDYLAPYYRADRDVKLAVSRGRARRAGDFGACMGSYGEKPADMSERRSQIWDILFAGGTGFYYWMFPGTGMSEDIQLSDKHAVYQCEVIEEVMSGIGEVFTGAERIFHPVVILDSQTSGICDQLEKKGEPLTTQENSIEAFQFVLEDIGFNPHTITSPELVDGWLTEHGAQVLILPGVNSMSDGEIAAVRQFAQGGGVVIADILPGLRMPNGNLRKAAPLADVFGVKLVAGQQTVRARGSLHSDVAPPGSAGELGDALTDPRVQPDIGQAVGRIDTGDGQQLPALYTNQVGNGRACLLNASFSSYTTLRAETGAYSLGWMSTVRHLLGDALKPEFSFEVNGNEERGLEISPFRNGAGYLVGVEDLGFGAYEGRRRAFSVKLPGQFHVYEMRSGRKLGDGATDTIEDKIPARGHRAYCLLPYAVGQVSVSAASASVRPGDTVRLQVDVPRGGDGASCLHVVRLEAKSPDGSRFFPFRRVLKMPAAGPLEVLLTFAFNDAPGQWSFTATDISSGLKGEVALTVGGGE